MSEPSGSRQPTPTGWTKDTTFSGFEANALRELARVREGVQSRVFGQIKAEAATHGHDCPGQIYTDLYWDDSDGHVHLGVSIWYDCESYLEIMGDVVVA